jgi:hypothetical protein
MKEPNFFIHYEPIDSESMDLEVFWKSIIWFNKLLKEIYIISNINADIEIRTIQPKKWSIVIQLLIEAWMHHQAFF